MIEIERVESREDAEWDAFIVAAPDGTLFHSLSFLAYHPEGRFREHRWKAREKGTLVAVATFAETAAKEGAFALRSPYGGSFGGWIAAKDISSAAHLELIERSRDAARAAGASSLAITTMPAPLASAGERTEFALFTAGARLVGEELTHVVPLDGTEDDILARAAGASKRGARKAERLGTSARLGGAGDLPAFHSILAADVARKGATPTHTLAELQDLARRFPRSFTLHLAENGAPLVGGVLVVRCNERVALSFYTTRVDAPEANRCMDLLMERAILEAKRAGFAQLDLGTTSIGGALNPGLATFKEEWGGVPYVRRNWRLEVQ